MMTLFPENDTPTWNPHSHRGEKGFSRRALRRRDIWFFVGILAFMVLLFFVWQQHRGLRLAGEVARLEARREALRARIMEKGVTVAMLRQPDHLLAGVQMARHEGQGLDHRVFVTGRIEDRSRDAQPVQEGWLASVGLEVPRAMADTRR